MGKHTLDKHYNDFAGLDTTSNKLKQNPAATREGTKNNRYTFQDEIARRYGFQHKTELISGCEWGLFEYKFKDINTGQSKSEILGIDALGNLNKLNTFELKLEVSAPTSIASYSFYYNGSTFIMEFLDAAKVVLGSVNVSQILTLDGLVNDINFVLGLTGLVASIESQGIPTTSPLPAYLLDVVYEKDFVFNGVGLATDLNSVFIWETITYPQGTTPPFAYEIATLKDDPNYEGVTWQNAFNSIYITVGGWVWKYDGFSVYRAGMPRMPMALQNSVGYNGFFLSAAPTTVGWTDGVHNFLVRLQYRDPNGLIIYGKSQPVSANYYKSFGNQDAGSYEITFTAPNNLLSVDVAEMANGADFPVYAAKLDGAKTIGPASGPTVVTVDVGHNVLVGMALRWNSPNLSGGGEYSTASCFIYLRVLSVTATTITVDVPAGMTGGATMSDNQTVNGVYIPDDLFGKQTDRASDNVTDGVFNAYGVSYVFGATKAGAGYTAPFYECAQISVPHNASTRYTATIDGTNPGDNSLTIPYDDTLGEELPRACRYLSLWQNQLVQAGRPYLADYYSTQYYPTVFSPPNTSGSLGLRTQRDILFDTYSEASLCDFQSAYWSDALYIEGFPQSGLNEEDFQNQFSDEIRGLAPNKEALFVFKQRTTAYMTGVVATGNIVKEFLEADVGACCHKSIQDVQGALMFMDQDSGFWSVVTGRLPEFIGYGIQDQFKLNDQKSLPEEFFLRRAWAQNYKFQDIYLCYIPAGSVINPSDASCMFAFDYAAKPKGLRLCWYKWQGINCLGGLLATASDELLFSERSSTLKRVWKQKATGSIYDYSDHTSPIEWDYRSAFITFNFPTIDKHWVQYVINSIQGRFDLIISQYANFLDAALAPFSTSFLGEDEKTAVKKTFKCNQPKLSGFSLGFYNNKINQDIRIQGWELEYSADFDMGEVKK